MKLYLKIKVQKIWWVMKCFLNWRKEITETLRKSVTIDWQYKEAVRAKCVFSLNALQRYKYPPDKQEEAITYVIKQAEGNCWGFNWFYNFDAVYLITKGD